MNFDRSVPAADRHRILKALGDIRKFGTTQQALIARFIEESAISIHLGTAQKVGGSGSVRIERIVSAQLAVWRGGVTISRATQFIQLNIARETIDTGGQRGIEGTLVHEGKHAMDYARMIASFSAGGSGSVSRAAPRSRTISILFSRALVCR